MRKVLKKVKFHLKVAAQRKKRLSIHFLIMKSMTKTLKIRKTNNHKI